jgi:hypothetical protein
VHGVINAMRGKSAEMIGTLSTSVHAPLHMVEGTPMPKLDDAKLSMNHHSHHSAHEC